MTGRKDDTGKPDLSLIPLSALTEEARGFMLGAAKYGRDNYRAGLAASRLIAACLRHVLAWQEGEENDSESGASHLGHARCCLAMLLECQRLGTLRDDRYPAVQLAEQAGEVILEMREKQILTTTRLPDGTEVQWGRGGGNNANGLLDYIK